MNDATPILLLSGFGVGGFHYDRNVPELARDGARRVFTMDVLGQGLSWPTADPAPGGDIDRQGFEWGFGGEACSETNGAELTYSCRMWRDQVSAPRGGTLLACRYGHYQSPGHAAFLPLWPFSLTWARGILAQ